MAKRVRQEPPKVYCDNCMYATIAEDGISFSLETGKYFMCWCPFEDFKQFINKPRICRNFREKK